MAIVDGHIRCHRCSESKPLGDFQPSVAKAGCGACRACKYADKREWEKRNTERVAAAQNRRRRQDPGRHRATVRKHYRDNPEHYRNYNLARYGITAAEYDARLAEQGGGCACCGATSNRNGKRLFVDHDHETGAVRGIVCLNCNRGIAALGDDVDGVRRALAYLERAHQPVPGPPPTIRINLLQGVN